MSAPLTYGQLRAFRDEYTRLLDLGAAAGKTDDDVLDLSSAELDNLDQTIAEAQAAVDAAKAQGQ
jgi:hypothetical protein